MVGGFGFVRQQFNHATQAYRQPGSTLKPFIYSAALQERVMPASLIDDAPWQAADGWAPQNSSGRYAGMMTMRQALAQSSNMVTIRLLEHVGLPKTRAWLERFGFDMSKQPQNMTLALGTGQISPLQMARAYSVFANGGWLPDVVLIERITDARGKVLFSAPPAAPLRSRSPVIPERNAWLTASLLNEVTQNGTARQAQVQLKRNDLFGKTGTTDKAYDAWFAGFHPHHVSVVWVGYGQPRSLGSSESGGRTALPIWIDYMKDMSPHLPRLSVETAPSGLVFAQGDWRYAEWRDAGWVAAISQNNGTQYATSTQTTLDVGEQILD
jgi:penicillin-binding protein 1A